MEDFVTRVERDVNTVIADLQGVVTLLQNGQPINEELRQIRRNLSDIEIDVSNHAR